MSAPLRAWRSIVRVSCLLLAAAALADDAQPSGRELFTHEWSPNDPLCDGGDGLGPLFNATSCLSCHSQGGVGGAGPADRNARVGTVFSIPSNAPPAAESPEGRAREREQVQALHPGFLESRSVALQRSSTNEAYQDIRARPAPRKTTAARASIFGEMALVLLGRNVNPLAQADQTGQFAGEVVSETASPLPRLASEEIAELSRIRKASPAKVSRHDSDGITLILSERNTPALFGSALIDRIPDEVLIAAAEKKYVRFPEVSGRLHVLDGIPEDSFAEESDVASAPRGDRIGRFGWKAQTATLHEFVVAACASELGLQVPGQAQAIPPYDADYRAPGLDLTEVGCRTLTAFVSQLPPPRQLPGKDSKSRTDLEAGLKFFEEVGCAACHTPKLGEVSGIYSDLLLHDMGAPLSDPGASYGSGNSDKAEFPLPPLAAEGGWSGGNFGRNSLRQEWRTPPLWGLRDSAPYLHDGRASTIEHAIVLHAGEAQRSMRLCLKLSSKDRRQLLAFLDSLAAPE